MQLLLIWPNLIALQFGVRMIPKHIYHPHYMGGNPFGRWTPFGGWDPIWGWGLIWGVGPHLGVGSHLRVGRHLGAGTLLGVGHHLGVGPHSGWDPICGGPLGGRSPPPRPLMISERLIKAFLEFTSYILQNILDL